MRTLMITTLLLAGFAIPLAASTPADAHGAKSKRYYGKHDRRYRGKRRSYRSYRGDRHYGKPYNCSAPGPYFFAGQYPAWAACAFAPRGFD